MPRSRYDDIHDRFDPIKTGKSGTRYERLAAMVLKALNQNDVVVHDIKLRGDSTVPHQIDVSIGRNGIDHRVVVECKDFDIRGAKVGLDIVRSFRSVAEDTGIDEAIIVTCNGFTAPAVKFAKAKGIKLAILRSFEPEDKEGRVQKIVLDIHIRGIVEIEVTRMSLDQENHDLFESELQRAGVNSDITPDTPVTFMKGGEIIQFNTFLFQRATEHAGDDLEGEQTMQLLPRDWTLSVAGGSPISFEKIDVRYVMANDTETTEITSNRIAELILADLTGHDTVIFADQLALHQVKPDGTVG